MWRKPILERANNHKIFLSNQAFWLSNDYFSGTLLNIMERSLHWCSKELWKKNIIWRFIKGNEGLTVNYLSNLKHYSLCHSLVNNRINLQTGLKGLTKYRISHKGLVEKGFGEEEEIFIRFQILLSFINIILWWNSHSSIIIILSIYFYLNNNS
jgi:hypothetical protein